MIGGERLAVQGMPLAMTDVACKHLGDTEKCELSGDSFNLFSLAPVLIGQLTTFGVPRLPTYRPF